MRLPRARGTAAAKLALAAVAIAAVCLPPERARGWSASGFSLDLDQRDVRVFDNFEDPTANDNASPSANFPGATGAELAIWKAVVEWGSERHGNGGGDPHQPGDLGSGGANFDPSWQGAAPDVGEVDGNVFSAVGGSAPGVFGWAEATGAGGWRARFPETWLWKDGPGTLEAGSDGDDPDLQGVATHLYGHALGLEHGVPGSTMQGFASPVSTVLQRSLAPDDVAGVQSIYGAAAAGKPRIESVEIADGVVTVRGQDFDPANNELWFTRATSSADGAPVVVAALAAVDGAITTPLPVDAGPGDVLVRVPGAGGGERLSNAYPLDPASDPTLEDPISIDFASPSTVPAVVVDPQGGEIELGGSGFYRVAEVWLDGQLLDDFPPQYQVWSDTSMSVSHVLATQLGVVDLTLGDGLGFTASTPIRFLPNDPPTLEVGMSDPAFTFSSVPVRVTGSSRPGDVFLVWVSQDDAPTLVPDVLELDIGAAFTTLFLATGFVVPPAGHASIEGTFPGVQPGTSLFWQGSVLDGESGAFPLVPTNVQKTTFLF